MSDARRPPRICLVTDRRLVAPDARTTDDEIAALERWLDEAIEAGVDAIQVRERDLEAARLLGVVSRLVARARGRGTRVVVNDRADVAGAAGADGVHLRADGVEVSRVRRLGPAHWVVGRSVHTLAEVEAHQGADYLLFGTVFPSRTKPDGGLPQGLDALARAVRASRAPVLAIGGLDPARARQCHAAGAAGVAAIGWFLPEGRVPGALGPARAVAAMRAAFSDNAGAISHL